MANKFAALARKETELSPIMTGRTKIETRDIIRDYPDGVTVNEFDIITLNNDDGESTFPVFAFAEDDTKCFFGGAILTKIALAWVDSCDGVVEEASAQLLRAGGVKIKLAEGKTKQGRSVTTVTII